MDQVRARFAPLDIASLSLSCALGLVAGILTFLGWTQSEALLLSYPLMPGLIAGLLVTGGHGGTAVQEAIAPWVASMVNAIFYFGLVVIARLIWKKLISPPHISRH